MKNNILNHIKQYKINYILSVILVISIILNYFNINKEAKIINYLEEDDIKEELKTEYKKDDTNNKNKEILLEDKLKNNEEEVNFIVNINTASKEELMRLSGIGEKTAEKIMDFRKKNKFIRKEDIKNVSGIGDVKYNNICNNITI